jgi:hypothetical protein
MKLTAFYTESVNPIGAVLGGVFFGGGVLGRVFVLFLFFFYFCVSLLISVKVIKMEVISILSFFFSLHIRIVLFSFLWYIKVYLM